MKTIENSHSLAQGPQIMRGHVASGMSAATLFNNVDFRCEKTRLEWARRGYDRQIQIKGQSILSKLFLNFMAYMGSI